jgi:hypothetical protein
MPAASRITSALDLPVLLLRQDRVGGSSGEATIYTYSLMRKSPTGPYAMPLSR